MRLKLFWKLGLTYLVLQLLTIGIVYVFTTRAVEQNILDSTFSHLESLIELAEARPADVDDSVALRDWTTWMAESGARVTVIASNGVVLADSDENPETMENHAQRPEIRQAFEAGRGRATRFSNTVNSDLVYLAVRYDWGSSPPVVLRLATMQVEVSQAIAEVRGPMATVSLVVLAIGGIVSLFFSRLFASRVRRLRELSRRVSEGDFRPMPVASGDDELAELAHALSLTAERFSKSIQSLEEERNLSRAMLAAMSEGVAVVDADRRVRFANRAFRDQLKLDLDGEAIKGRPLVEVTHHKEIRSMVRQVLERGVRTESEIRTASPSSLDLLVRAAPVGDEGAVVVLLDISGIRRLERVRRDFVANVSHELKTPLTAIQGFAETLLSGALDEPENSRRFAEIIRDHAVRLGRLTEDLLKLSRIEAGKVEIELRPVLVREIIDQCVETTRLKAGEKKQTLDVDVPEDVPRALADPHVLQEVLQNLLDNAVQYSPEGRHIAVRAASNENEVSIAVEDDGIGISAANHDRIFERFYRVDAARSRKVGGTGLGLAIARHLVESMHGRIELVSQLGQGSTFTVFLPKYDSTSA